MLKRRDVLMHLSEEWLRLLHALQTSGVAHGDLQHGNIIVEHGQLRLVDHDGIFVPKMEGWSASEVGHQHYQHPRRDAQHFDAKLDHFSAIVIYLSLLSLADRPSLWDEHHDENLLFTKTDFIDPAASALFTKIREIGPEHTRLADVLANAATGSPDDVPCLLDLVKTKSTLPAWMTAPVDLDARTKTREVVPTEPRLPPKTVHWTPWQEKSRGSSVPSTPASATVQTLFSATPAAATVITDPNAVLENSVIFAKEFVRRYFLLWYWGAYLLLKFLGFGFVASVFVGLVCLLIGCVTFGLYRALDEKFKARQSNLIGGGQHPAPPAFQFASQPAVSSWNPHMSIPVATASANVSDPIVGNIVLGIYHLGNCDWVDRISSKNRVAFSTASEALSHGFKPCRICSPAT